MPLENSPPIVPPNEAYITDLNSDWPTGGDDRTDGDNHLRGIKNVLKRQFPNLGQAPVTLTAAQINSGSNLIPAGTVCLFYQAAAPTGWTRVGATGGWRMIIIGGLADGSGYEGGGSDEPFYNSKVPSHNHWVPPANTGTESSDHVHSGATGYMNQNASHGHSTGGFNTNHQHLYNEPASPLGGIALQGGGGNTVYRGVQQAWTSTANVDHIHGVYAADTNHTHNFTTGGRSAAHTHYIAGRATDANSGSNWNAKVSVCMLARKN